ncbi:hypothetical protein TSUD_396450 [Trifolium subterraneum]|uniref:DUF1664 domain-containing protein n=1 Tax=Trifolium subterraneum TaxID=3900 RepID=A0A2Z6N4C3_TRISU|nr:hypothetical protein TSUD_396450 [Trifolium subterraneum]
MAMAMQSGIGLSKIIFVAATGYTGTLLLKNGKLSELIGELQLLVKGLENHGNQAEGEGEMDLVAQVHCLVNDFRALVPNRPIPIVVNDGNSLLVSAAALGVAGYGYIWWKGLSFSDIMFLTKHNMEKAVADLTTKLQHASDVIAVNKVGNTVNGIHGELGNVREQLEKLFRERQALDPEVPGSSPTIVLGGRAGSDAGTCLCASLSLPVATFAAGDICRRQHHFSSNLPLSSPSSNSAAAYPVQPIIVLHHQPPHNSSASLTVLLPSPTASITAFARRCLSHKWRERTNKLLENQDYANEGLDLLINFIRTNCTRARDSFQAVIYFFYSLVGSILPEQPKLPGRSPAMLTYPGNQGLKVIVESLYSLDRSASDTIMLGGLDKLEQQQSPLLSCLANASSGCENIVKVKVIVVFTS